jgi:uroporphyrinogen-III synthase
MKVWVTRAEPEARRTGEALAAAGHKPLIAPLIQVRPLNASSVLAKGLDGVGALAFTSANGVRAFSALRPISDRHLPTFTVGAATARAAREAGFVTVVSADGDVGALAAIIAANPDRPPGVILHPGSLEPAGDLIGDLEQRGLKARSVAVYETLAQAPTPALLAALEHDPPGVEAALLHSPRAAMELAKLLEARPTLSRAMAVICISKAAAAPLKPFTFARRAIAEAPNETAMFARLTP